MEAYLRRLVSCYLHIYNRLAEKKDFAEIEKIEKIIKYS